jgi:hypothetical protein
MAPNTMAATAAPIMMKLMMAEQQARSALATQDVGSV